MIIFYKNLQFYDFNLLREKYSLSPATHIKVQYTVDDLTWNGPEINQAKKMITMLTAGTGIAIDDPYKVKETWGWDEDVASGAGAKTITYSNAFYASPAVGIAAQNMATGDYYTISSKTKTGFVITFYNSSAAAQDRTFDYMAKGYGLKS